MCLSYARRFATCVALVMVFAQAASAADILIGDAKSQPESLTVAPGGDSHLRGMKFRKGLTDRHLRS